MKQKFKIEFSPLQIAKIREANYRTKLENGVMKRREERDAVRKAFAIGEGINYKRIILTGKLDGHNTPYIIKKSK